MNELYPADYFKQNKEHSLMLTWTKLLGPWDESYSVDENMIVRDMGGGWYKRVWTFDSGEDALINYSVWKMGC